MEKAAKPEHSTILFMLRNPLAFALRTALMSVASWDNKQNNCIISQTPFKSDEEKKKANIKLSIYAAGLSRL